MPIYTCVSDCQQENLGVQRRIKKKRKKVLYNANKNDGKFHSRYQPYLYQRGPCLTLTFERN